MKFNVNPFPPSVTIWHHKAKISILMGSSKKKKKYYERREYESIDEKSLS